MPRRHPSHFSLSQALSFLLSLPQGASTSQMNGTSNGNKGGTEGQLELGILTDLTHRLEHHALQEDMDTFVEGLRGWVAKKRVQQQQKNKGQANGVAAEQSQRQVNGRSKKAKRHGEGSGSRWWAPVWDEEEAEMAGGEGRVVLKQEGRDMDEEHGDDNDSIDWETIHVPDIVVAFDGMVVDFDRKTGRPTGWR